jgi:hypothetical protein
MAFPDLTGRRFGRLTVVCRIENHKRRGARFRCLCDCDGKEIDVFGCHLIAGNTLSCGCLMKEMASKRRLRDLTGQKFGRLTVENRAANSNSGDARWFCRCACGNLKSTIVHGSKMISGETRSCGCLQRERTSQAKTTHGHARGRQKSREYKSLLHAIGRIFNPKDSGYPGWGGRGLTMDDCYRFGPDGKTGIGIERLIADIGRCPPGKTLGRIDNDLGYIVGNVRWETWGEQANNTRRNVFWTIEGRTQTRAQWLREIEWHPNKLTSSVRSINRRLNHIPCTIPLSTADSDPLDLTEASLDKAGFIQSVSGVWLHRDKRRALFKALWDAMDDEGGEPR